MDYIDLPSWMSMKNLDPGTSLRLYLLRPTIPLSRILFTIPIDLYNFALSPIVPITGALVYATIITFLNAVNERRKYRPWAFSRSRLFKLMVVTHNIILAVYSAWTFVGMVNALRTSVYMPWEDQGLAGTLDSLCKIHGPRGPGSAAVYGESTSAWSVTNHLVHLGADGLTPETTDVGRIWNQGLAFYGWLFYLSKFYEVLDTLIIIAKGKKSSFLQTFHHAGAMICMWAGMRYMSPPIWMFVLVNSFIHSIMYTFYLFTAIGVRVPVWFKRTLTSLQILQFVVGVIYAFAHLFIKYESPVSVPYIYHLGNVISDAALDASSTASSVFASATAQATDDWPALLKKFALRAAGREGLAQNVYDHSGHTFGVDATKAVQDWVAREETRYRNDLEWTNCIDTSGQAFAIMLNVVYLLPLTWLFANFFIQSYLRRIERRRSSTASQKAQLARESVNDAARRSSRRLSEAFEDPQAGFDDTGDEVAIFDEEEIKKKINTAASKMKKGATDTAYNARETMTKNLKIAQEEADKLTSNAKEAMSNNLKTAQEESRKLASNAKEVTSNYIESAREESGKLASKADKKAGEAVTELKREANDVASTIKEKAGPVAEDVEQYMAETRDNLKAQAGSLKDKAQDQYEAGREYVKEGVDDAKKEYEKAQSSARENRVEEGARDATSSNRDSKKQDEDKESRATKSESQGTSELSPKEKVTQQKSSNAKTKAEASTGDAKEDDSPSKQSSSQDVNQQTSATQQKSGKEERSKQDTSVKGGQRENVANEEVSGQTVVKKAINTARDTASNVADTVQDTIESPPPAVKDAADKVQDTVKQAQDTASNVLENANEKYQQSSEKATSSKNDASRKHGKADSQDYEDQKESWIQVSQSSQEAKKLTEEKEQSSGDGSSTSGPTKSEEDKIIDESEALRDHVFNGLEESGLLDDESEEENAAAPDKQEQDKIIDESEAVRREPVDQ